MPSNQNPRTEFSEVQRQLQESLREVDSVVRRLADAAEKGPAEAAEVMKGVLDALAGLVDATEPSGPISERLAGLRAAAEQFSKQVEADDQLTGRLKEKILRGWADLGRDIVSIENDVRRLHGAARAELVDAQKMRRGLQYIAHLKGAQDAVEDLKEWIRKSQAAVSEWGKLLRAGQAGS